MNKKNVISSCQINIDGLSAHSAIATNKFIIDHNIKVLALQETGKLKPPIDIFSSLLTYGVTNVRGVSLSVSNYYHPQQLLELEDKEIDAVFVLCTINKKSVLIVSSYCRPEITSTKSLKAVLDLLTKAWAWCKKSAVKSMYVMGDFNARSPNWGDSIENPRGKLLGNFVESIPEARLHSPGKQTYLHSKGGSVIDLSISFGTISSLLSTPNVEHCYTLFTGAPTKGHIPVIQDIVVGEISKSKQTVLDYDKADWDKWTEELNNACYNLLSAECGAKELFDDFQKELDSCNKRNIPHKTVCKYSKPFWTENLSKLSNALQKASANYKQRSDPHNKVILEQCKNDFEENLISEKNKWIHSQLEGLNINESIEFWKRYKRKFVQKEVNFIGSIYKTDKSKELITDDENKEEALYYNYFTGEHLKDYSFDEDLYCFINQEVDELKEKNWGIYEEINHHQSTQNEEVDEDGYSGNLLDAKFLSEEIGIQEVTESIKLQKTAGKCSDNNGFHPSLLKRLPQNAVKLLTTIFNKVLDSGIWIWDSSVITFIRKPSKKSYLLPGSYRPLTISSYIGKVLERVLQKRLILYCQQHKVIDDSQEGFLPNRNTSRYLYRMTSSILEARRKKLQAMILLIDFQKAFDSVPIPCMIYKLNKLGINGQFLRLIYSFLNKRTISIKVNDFIGPSRPVGKFGLPQGSVLSPLLFIIYISDLLQTQNLPASVIEWTTSFKYADDGSVLIVGKDVHDCAVKMRKICNYLTTWCEKWRLAVNCDKDKTEVILIKSKNSENTVLQKLQISKREVEYVTSSKVLGITIDDDLNFSRHSKATLSACWDTWHKLSDKTTRKRGLNCSTLRILFKTAVLTKLLYASPIWLGNNLSTFDNLLTRAMLKISGAQFYPPNVVSQAILNLPPLVLQFEMIVVKFYLKSLTQDDHIKSLILQLEEVPEHPYYLHVIWTKNFLAWKKSIPRSSRAISLIDLPSDHFVYTKALITSYQSKKWNTQIVSHNFDYFTEELMSNQDAALLIDTESLSLYPILFRSDTRLENTNLLDFLHGRCLRFKNFKGSIVKDKNVENMICLDCNEDIDSSLHKLFICKAFSGKNRDIILNTISHQNIISYVPRVIFSSDQDLKNAFKKQVDFICASSKFDDEYRPRKL